MVILMLIGTSTNEDVTYGDREHHLQIDTADLRSQKRLTSTEAVFFVYIHSPTDSKKLVSLQAKLQT